MEPNTTPLNNPMAELAHLYNTVEARLRWWMDRGEWKKLGEIAEDPEVRAALRRGDHQLRHVMRTFQAHGNVKVEGHGRAGRWMWIKDSPPFVLGQRMLQKAAAEPSPPVVYEPVPKGRPEGSVARRKDSMDNGSPPDELELVFKGLSVVVGKNVATGRLRIVIEEQG